MNKWVAILISGKGSNMVSLVESMVGDHVARPCLVLSDNPCAEGLEKARKLRVPVAVVDHRAFSGDKRAFESAMIAELDKASPQIICLAGFMRILSREFLLKWHDRVLNIHPSLLPKYKGLDTHARAIEAGDRVAGCTVHKVMPQVDSGEIMGTAKVQIYKGDTPEALAKRVLEKEHMLYPKVLKRYSLADYRPVFMEFDRVCR
ncbi:MAG: phosphoribosylglycinamide formyltransferase [Roseovarius sp.]|nr:phosphoribosylglycinamide formyltransferase [Roseovarius sp.]